MSINRPQRPGCRLRHCFHCERGEGAAIPVDWARICDAMMPWLLRIDPRVHDWLVHAGGVIVDGTIGWPMLMHLVEFRATKDTIRSQGSMTAILRK